MKDLVILGAGGYGREVAQLVGDINRDRMQWNLLGYIDEDPLKKGRVLNDDPVLGGFEWFDAPGSRGRISAVLGVGSPASKREFIKKAGALGLDFATLIHPSVIMGCYGDLGEGVVVCARSIISVNIRLGCHVALNPGCGIGHDTVIADYATLLWNVTVAGNVEIGEGCLLGSGSIVIQQRRIGCWSTIGAGAVVVKDIEDRCTAVGIPARPITNG